MLKKDYSMAQERFKYDSRNVYVWLKKDLSMAQEIFKYDSRNI